jgi:hypothetical protein
MALCDQRIDGPDDTNCLRHAQQAADAANFAKIGFPVVLTLDLRPQAYPYVIKKPEKESYRSQKVLGKGFARLVYRRRGSNERESKRGRKHPDKESQKPLSAVHKITSSFTIDLTSWLIMMLVGRGWFISDPVTLMCEEYFLLALLRVSQFCHGGSFKASAFGISNGPNRNSEKLHQGTKQSIFSSCF